MTDEPREDQVEDEGRPPRAGFYIRKDGLEGAGFTSDGVGYAFTDQEGQVHTDVVHLHDLVAALQNPTTPESSKVLGAVVWASIFRLAEASDVLGTILQRASQAPQGQAAVSADLVGLVEGFMTQAGFPPGVLAGMLAQHGVKVPAPAAPENGSGSGGGWGQAHRGGSSGDEPGQS